VKIEYGLGLDREAVEHQDQSESLTHGRGRGQTRAAPEQRRAGEHQPQCAAQLQRRAGQHVDEPGHAAEPRHAGVQPDSQREAAGVNVHPLHETQHELRAAAGQAGQPANAPEQHSVTSPQKVNG